MVCAACLLPERTDGLTMAIMLRTEWSLGSKCLSPPSVVSITTDKPPVATADLTIVTDGSVVTTVELLLTEAFQSWLQHTALL